ncbi:TetR/AcrR family transcriptional regulator [Rhizobium sp. CNPSo 3464]|uniref:TetR/AcrR family transcriptional regulator n=1 Tax=Rhizobium sp. CNPSo 3464 TaxID=3021406 RepID=UPI00254DFA74|nr:TetR/AcrR family transcriptional regulator [Rhizobium sp. CNPSo 3464]MDK4743662.1 TetR/AcrR family transcriptional regulator [Rhizobium sp. CNPSo 3464]
MSPKKEQLIAVATDLFSRHGFHPVGVDRILAEAGVARMTLYNHFPGKEDLISAVLDRRYQDIMASLRAYVKPTASAREQLRCIFAWHEAWFDTPEFSGCLFERALAEFGTDYPNISNVAIQYKKTMTAWMGDMLKTLLPEHAATRVASIFLILLDGATIDARAFHDPTVATRVWGAAEAIIEREIALTSSNPVLR